MERHCKRMKSENSGKRSPLQHLNRLPIHKITTNKVSNLSSCSSAPAISSETPKIRSRFVPSSNSCSTSSYSSRIKHSKRSKAFSNNEPNKSTKVMSRSKENEMPRKPFPQKLEKKQQPQCFTPRDYGKKPSYQNGRRSKLSSVQGNPDHNLKKRYSQEFEAETKNSRENGTGIRAIELIGVSTDCNLNLSENCSLNLGHHKTVIEEDLVYERSNGNCGSDVKTPPVKASLSPEIQCSKMVVFESAAATPVCYGAGHHVSGVTDKRKCRRRGSLRGGRPIKANLFDAEKNSEYVSTDPKEFGIPSLAEASVRWHLSPCQEGREDHGIDPGKIDLLSSHSMLCGLESDLLGGESSYSDGDHVGNVGSKRRFESIMLSPRKATVFEGLLETSDDELVEALLATTPDAAHSGEDVKLNDGKHFSANLFGDDPELSIGSLSGGNIIQTPDSISSSKAHHSNSIWPKLDSITENLERVNLSPRAEITEWDAPCLGFLQKNGDSVSSWVSDITSGNLSVAQMRISWRDGLRSRTVETDEFDSCCLLSDEEIDADRSAGEQLRLDSVSETSDEKDSYQSGKNCQRSCLGVESGENKENIMSPVLLDYEPCIYAKGKEKPSSLRTDARAESICTDGCGLIASDDSDWIHFHESHSFRVK